MTGCIYISPPVVRGDPTRGVVPTLMADTMATLKVKPPGAVPILPTNVTPALLKAPTTVKLVRKLNIFDRAAVAMAGDGHLIRQALTEFRARLERFQHVPGLLDSSRPMRFLGDLAEKVGIEALGCCHVPETGVLNTLAPGGTFSLSQFGECACIGSGRNDLIAFARQQDQYFKRADGASAYSDALGFACAVNGDQLGKELVGSANATWGGYTEWAQWIAAEKRWRRGPKSLNIFLIARSHKRQRITTSLALRAIAYDPGGRSGRVLSLGGQNTPWAQDFILENLLDEDPATERDAGQFWTGWRPDVCTVTTISVTSGYNSIIRTTNPSEMNDVIFEFSQDSWRYGLNKTLFDRMSASAVERLGGVYISTAK